MVATPTRSTAAEVGDSQRGKHVTRRLAVRAHPGASRRRVSWEGEVLHVWVTARALEGAANQAVLAAVAEHLGVRLSAVGLVAGERSRDKVVEVTGWEQ